MKFERKLAKESRRKPRAFYSYVNRKVSSRASVGPLKDSDGNIKTDDKSMTETLNQFFSSVFTREDLTDLPVPEDCYHGDAPLTSLHMTPEQVQAKLGKLRPGSAPGPDKIYPRVLHAMKLQLSTPLSIIFNKSLDEGVVPLEWKNANVTPIFKKGRKNGTISNHIKLLRCILFKRNNSVLELRNLLCLTVYIRFGF